MIQCYFFKGDSEKMNEQQPKSLPFRFSGNGGEYFKIGIVNSILTVFTLGIYSSVFEYGAIS
jgi:uncharacterized membrane protein YjgN (DUF898 family)